MTRTLPTSRADCTRPTPTRTDPEHAAVVGVILNLALFFGYHTLWANGFAGGFDWVAALIALASFVALFKFKANVLTVLGVSALAGLLIKVFGG